MATIQIKGRLAAEDYTRFSIGLEFLTMDGTMLVDLIKDFKHSEPVRTIQVFKTDYGRCRVTIEQLGPPEDEALDILEESNEP